MDVGLYNYVVSAHKPSAVTHSLTGNFTSPDDLNLILAKRNRLEIHLLSADGLKPMLDVPIYGSIVIMELVRPRTSNQDMLLICTDRNNFSLLSFDSNFQEIITRASGDLQDRISRPVDSGRIGLVDPKCRVIGLHLYDFLFKIMPIDAEGNLSEAVNIRLEEQQVISMCFLDGTASPTLCVLYQDIHEARHVRTYEINMKTKEMTASGWSQMNVEGGSSVLIPVPHPFGGVLVVGLQSVAYLNNATCKVIQMRPTQIVAWGRVDPNGSRYLVGDIYGRLSVLVLVHDANYEVVNLTLELLGRTSSPSSISYLDNGVVFIGSTFGDSQLIRLNSEKDASGSYLEVLESFDNLGPIVDMAVVDLERNGQSQVVTCSGVYRDGSLRVIRNGIGIQEQTSVQLAGIGGLFPLRPAFDHPFDQYLVQSYISETRILAIQGEEMDEINIDGFLSECPTLFCCNVLHDQLLQVTPTSVRLVDCSSLQLLTHWDPPLGSSITVAHASPTQVLVALGGGVLVLLEVGQEKGTITQTATTTLEHEISCLHLNLVGADPLRASHVALGMWTDITVRVLELPSLRELSRDVLGVDILPRSVLFSRFASSTYLFCGLGDGTLFTYILDPDTSSLTDKKKSHMGTQPITLSNFQSNQVDYAFVACDRPAVIYLHRGKLLFSNVNLGQINQMAAFNPEAFQGCLAFANEENLLIGTIDQVQKLHIRKIPLQEQPRRIAHQASSQTYLASTIAYADSELDADASMDSPASNETSFLRLFDEQSFEVLDAIELPAFEQVCSLISAPAGAAGQHVYIVGTALAYPNEEEPDKGRILVLQVVQGKLSQVAEQPTKGAVYSLCTLGSYLVASINSRVQMYQWVESSVAEELTTYTLVPHAHVVANIVALYLKSYGDYIIVGDMMKSISVLAYKPVTKTLEEVARDYNPQWTTAVHHLEDRVFYGAEHTGNLFALTRNSKGVTEEERSRLQVTGMFHVGDQINVFRSGSLVMDLLTGSEAKGEVKEDSKAELDAMDVGQPSVWSAIQPQVLFGTVHGVLGVVAPLAASQHRFLSALQSQLQQVIHGVGGFKHQQWRMFVNERKSEECLNVIDGDLIECCSDLPPNTQQQIASALGLSVDEMMKRVDDLTRIH